jgi:hypothetical protein
MFKRDDFLMMVQTAMILHFKNRLSQLESGFNAFGLAEYHGSMGDAVRASYRIPKDMTSVKAAADFMQFFYWQHMDGQEEFSCPSWFYGLDDRHL